MEIKSLKMKRMRWTVIAVVLAGMLLVFLGGYIQQRQQRAELAQQQRELSAELEDVMREQRALNVQLNELGSTGSLDSAARADDFVKPGELRFVIDNSQGVLEMYTEEEQRRLTNETSLHLD